ncbi:DUF5348 domain-containing protein [Paenibacillus peoriae]|uniref:DUF5348 domain-containing protein n=1 Tax=Paenibacillus TaxID=44249 RepID=UPI003F97D12F
MSESMKNQIREKLENLLPQIKKVTHMITDAEESWTDHYDRNDPDDLYLRRMFYSIGDVLDDAGQLIKRTTTQAGHEGVLYKRPDSRYGLGDMYFTTGQSVEFYRTDPDDGDRWEPSRIDHDGHDYYLAVDRNLPLEGLRVRIKYIPR